MAYGVVLLMVALGYLILQRTRVRIDDAGSVLRRAIASDWKGRLSSVLYLVGIALAFWCPWSAQLLYVLATLLWLVPDRRIEGTLHGPAAGDG